MKVTTFWSRIELTIGSSSGRGDGAVTNWPDVVVVRVLRSVGSILTM